MAHRVFPNLKPAFRTDNFFGHISLLVKRIGHNLAVALICLVRSIR
jgi:hypothetical protein